MFINPSQFSETFKSIKHSSLSHSTCKLVIFTSCLDIDALCASKAFATVLKKELITHRIVPIAGYSELKSQYLQLDDDIKNVILIGCGALIDLESFLDIDVDDYLTETENTNLNKNIKNKNIITSKRKIYVIDGHRPWNLDNIFGSHIIVCFDDGAIDDELEDQKKAYYELINDDKKDDEDTDNSEDENTNIENNEEEEEEEEEGSSRKKRRIEVVDSEREDDTDDDEDRIPSSQIKRKESSPLSPPSPKISRQQDDNENETEKAEEILEKYYSFGTTIVTTASLQVYSLLSLIGETSIDNLWLAVVGTTSLDSQYPQLYKQMYPLLKDEVTRLNPQNKGGITDGADSSSLVIETDYLLFLLRHWSLYDSMLYSSYVSAKLVLWQEEGRKKLHKMLARMGISLQVAHEQWVHMDMGVKKSLTSMLKKVAGLYELDDIVRQGVVRKFGYRGSVSASECVEALAALLESGLVSQTDIALGKAYEGQGQGNKEDHTIGEEIAEKEKIWVGNFWAGWDALDSIGLIEKGLENAKFLQQIIFRTGTAILEKRQVRNLRFFRLAVVKDGPELGTFRNPLALVRLGIWMAEGIVEADPKALPLVLASLDVEADTYLVLGLAARHARGHGNVVSGTEDDGLQVRTRADDGFPAAESVNSFGAAFQQVANQTGAKVRMDSFESSIIEVRKDDLAPFLEGLTLSGLV